MDGEYELMWIYTFVLFCQRSPSQPLYLEFCIVSPSSSTKFSKQEMELFVTFVSNRVKQKLNMPVDCQNLNLM
jgi:hypothetical protein